MRFSSVPVTRPTCWSEPVTGFLDGGLVLEGMRFVGVAVIAVQRPVQRGCAGRTCRQQPEATVVAHVVATRRGNCEGFNDGAGGQCRQQHLPLLHGHAAHGFAGTAVHRNVVQHAAVLSRLVVGVQPHRQVHRDSGCRARPAVPVPSARHGCSASPTLPPAHGRSTAAGLPAAAAAFPHPGCVFRGEAGRVRAFHFTAFLVSNGGMVLMMLLVLARVSRFPRSAEDSSGRSSTVKSTWRSTW